MNNERILPFGMATRLTESDLTNVSASGTSHGTGQYTHGPQGNDGQIDVEIDM